MMFPRGFFFDIIILKVVYKAFILKAFLKLKRFRVEQLQNIKIK